jgi:hypothetical protein
VNYILELNAFRDWVMINRASTGQIALWYALMSINNQTGWKEWFSVPNQTLQLMTGLSRQGLDKARNGLIQLGLIQYKKGKSNQAGQYKMISLLSDRQKVGTEGVTPVDTGVDTEVGTEGALQLTHEERGSSTYLNININKKDDDDRARDPMRKIAECYATLRGIQIHSLSSVDIGYISKLAESEIPLDFILQTMKSIADQYDVNSMFYFFKAINSEWKKIRAIKKAHTEVAAASDLPNAEAYSKQMPESVQRTLRRLLHASG